MSHWLSDVNSHFLLLVILSIVVTGWALRCYECESTISGDCGPIFRYSSFHTSECAKNVTHCALQRQPSIPAERQVAGIRRGCYSIRGQLEGLNETTGCRYHTRIQDGKSYTALYCFCDVDGCNGARGVLGLRYYQLVVCVLIIYEMSWASMSFS